MTCLNWFCIHKERQKYPFSNRGVSNVPWGSLGFKPTGGKESFLTGSGDAGWDP